MAKDEKVNIAVTCKLGWHNRVVVVLKHDVTQGGQVSWAKIMSIEENQL
jgi:hypothetical protein